MNALVGLSFEELDEQEMINVHGGATPTTATIASSLICGATSLAVSVSITVTAIASIKLF